jgi:glycine cleavage system H lipoate-binding protein
MIPGVYEFSWSAGHIVFLGVFYSVLIIIASTVVIALLRSLRTAREGRVDALRWHVDFEDLSPEARRCRHELSGEVRSRECEKGFDCRHCEGHPQFLAARPEGWEPVESSEGSRVGGFLLPGDRSYHRGHTWVRREEDEKLTIGLDDLGAHLVGKPDQLTLPELGRRLSVNGTAWELRKNDAIIRVLSPVEGIVEAHGSPDDDWLLKVVPTDDNLDHLLSAGEARGWMLREVERLHLSLNTGLAGGTLADGGVPVDDLSAAIPREDFDQVCGLMFLQP